MKKLVVANLKMNFTKDELINYLEGIKNKISNRFETVICPSFIYLPFFHSPDYKLGAQNTFYLEKGSYTGEVSPKQLKSLFVSYVIVGHSERRTYFKEDDLLIGKKIKACLDNLLIPIFCIGETLEERQLKKTSIVLKNQVLIGLKDIPKEDLSNIIIAYEPVWAIGTGKIPSISDIEETIDFIKRILQDKFQTKIKVLYGGSVNKENIIKINQLKVVDGLLIGSSSLQADYFTEMLDLID
ncbi:MAG: triose-phosphate isomerase [Bacilli bacterium]|jgi:triosephosphate isomerase